MKKSHEFLILMAEDDEDDIESITDAFDRINTSIRLIKVKDGQELIERLQLKINEGRKIPDLILLDINMPRKNGFETLEELRAHNKFCKIPVTMLSTTDNRETINDAYLKGANCYIVKPETDAEWSAMVKEVVKFWKDIAELPTY